MRKSAYLALAAALSVGTVAWADDANNGAAAPAQNAAQSAGDAVNNAANKTGDAIGNAANQAGNAAQAAGDKLNDTANAAGTSLDNAKNAKGIRWTFQTITQAALTKNGFDNVVERLVDADRERINKNKPSDEDLQKLDGIVAQIQKDWQDKYHQDFKMDDTKAVYNDQFAKVEAGTIGNNAQLAAAEEKNSANPNEKAGDKNLESDRQAALVTIATANGQPELKVPMIREKSITGYWWEINAPDNLDAATLRTNLEKQLTAVKDMKDQWPSDVNDAYRVVTQHVLEAVVDSQGQGAAAGNTAGATDTAQPAQSK